MITFSSKRRIFSLGKDLETEMGFKLLTKRKGEEEVEDDDRLIIMQTTYLFSKFNSLQRELKNIENFICEAV